MHRCFMTGCDKNTQWMLPWFYKNYKKYNDTQLIVMDFGMTPDMVKWVEDSTAGLGKITGAPDNVAGWFLKPVSMLNTPSKQTCWIDTDIEVRGDMSGVFDHIVGERLAMAEDIPWSKRRKETWHNSGVVAFEGRPQILHEWKKAVHDNPRVGDQEVLHSILDPLRRVIYIETLPMKYNFLRINYLDGFNDKDALAIHWTGPKGKQRIEVLIHEEARTDK